MLNYAQNWFLNMFFTYPQKLIKKMRMYLPQIVKWTCSENRDCKNRDFEHIRTIPKWINLKFDLLIDTQKEKIDEENQRICIS